MIHDLVSNPFFIWLYYTCRHNFFIAPTVLHSNFFPFSSQYDCVASCNCFTHVFTFSIICVFCTAGEIQCEQPNNSLYTFTGNLVVQKQTLPLSPDQLLLRVWLTVSTVGLFSPFCALFLQFYDLVMHIVFLFNYGSSFDLLWDILISWNFISLALKILLNRFPCI